MCCRHAGCVHTFVQSDAKGKVGELGVDWKWRPELGGWRLLEYGFPSDPERIAVSTANIPQRLAYDYWRDLAFSDFEADSGKEEKAFRARATGLCWERADFFMTESGALSGRRSRQHISQDGLDSLSIGLVINGQRRARHDDEATTTEAGGLFVYDAARPSSVAWGRHKGIYLVVRRPDVAAVLGRDIPAPDVLMRRLESSPMRHVLADQMLTLARHMNFLSANEQAYMLDQTIQMTLFALDRPGEEVGMAMPDSVLLRSALGYIERNIAEPGLSADRIVRAMGCSRATLYRCFGAEGLGIAETIRDLRLDRARMLLEQAPADLAIADIAVQCGLYDTTNFSRQFRRRFGISPTDVRQAELIRRS
jgi:AraC-like DNA-binding protein